MWYVVSINEDQLSEENFKRLIDSYKKEITSIVKKDVPRTFAANAFFGKKIEGVEVGREMLYKVCKALATYFVEVGYCQGLNFMVGFLL